ncbi:PH domain-containing protein [Nocardioides sp. YIM 152588]|uniref:PH domain-containing protein n=1 Tax=Nocardioides sp. YIM 152588 TaxID=3158259 RepID=UPI0032E3D205
MGFVSWISDPKVHKHLLRDDGEVIVQEVHRHWFAYVIPILEAVGALVLGTLVVLLISMDAAWFVLLLVLGVLAHAGWRALHSHRDRFVVTNMRVFRVDGVLAQTVATMPLTRILDISMRKPLHGRIIGFGHFVFESAAQDQGLRDIRYVGHPDELNKEIQRVVQRAGLRGPRVPN